MASAAVHALIAVTLIAAVAQAPRQPPPRPPMRVGTGIVLGRVIDAATNTPIADAIVTLSAGGAALKVITDPQGRFLFTRLPDARVLITATKAGYLPGRVGQRSPRGPGRLLQLAEGARVGDAEVRLRRLAAVSGTVQDEAGDPAAGVEVRLIERIVGVDGERVLASNAAAVTTTDDRGMYRLAHVAPGEYVVLARMPADMAMRVMLAIATSDQSAAMAVAQRAAAAASAGGSIERLVDIDSTLRVVAPAFHGGTSPSDAQPIVVVSGVEHRNVDVRVAVVPVARVAGTLYENGEPVPRARIRLTLPGSEVDVATATSDQTGRFVMMGVPAGAYTLHATRDQRSQAAQNAMLAATGRPQAPAEPTLWARQPVVAGAPDAASLTIAMQRGPKIRGRVNAAGAGQPLSEVVARLRITATPVTPGVTPAVARIEPDGTFETPELVPGRYLLSALPNGPGAEWRAASARAGARDLLDHAVAIDADLDDVVIIINNEPLGTIEGTVTTPQGTPDPAAAVAIVSADPDRLTTRRRRIVYTTATGAFSAPALPPGDYVVAVSTDERVERGLDREEIQRLIRSGTRVTIGAGESRTIDLRSGGL